MPDTTGHLPATRAPHTLPQPPGWGFFVNGRAARRVAGAGYAACWPAARTLAPLPRPLADFLSPNHLTIS